MTLPVQAKFYSHSYYLVSIFFHNLSGKLPSKSLELIELKYLILSDNSNNSVTRPLYIRPLPLPEYIGHNQIIVISLMEWER